MVAHLWIRSLPFTWIFATTGLARCAFRAIVRAAKPHPSPVPRPLFSGAVAEQEKELKTNAMKRHFTESLMKLAVERYRQAYHLVRRQVR